MRNLTTDMPVLWDARVVAHISLHRRADLVSVRKGLTRAWVIVTGGRMAVWARGARKAWIPETRRHVHGLVLLEQRKANITKVAV